MRSSLENLCGPGKPLRAEPRDAREFAALLRSGKARLDDAETKGLSRESRFDLAYNAAHALCLAALRWQGYRSSNRAIVPTATAHAWKAAAAVQHRQLPRSHDLEAALEQFRLIAADLAPESAVPALAGASESVIS